MRSDPAELRDQPIQVSQADTGLDISKYFLVLLKRKWLILFAALLVVAGVAFYTFSQTPIYLATATVIVESHAPQVLGKEVREVVDLSSGAYWGSHEYMRTQESVITSKKLAVRVAKKLNLDTMDQFWPDAGQVGAHTKARLPRTIDMAAGLLRGSIRVTQVKNSKLLRISVEHAKPAIAARLANGVAAEYLKQNVDYKLDQTSSAKEWLSHQLDDLKKQLELAENALHDFKRDHNIISVSMEDKQSLLSRRIEKLNEALTDIRMKRMEVEARQAQLRKVKDTDPLQVTVREVMDDMTVRALKETYLAEYREYEALKQRYLEKHPLVMTQKSKTDTVLAELQREVNGVVRSLDAEYVELRDNERKLAAALQSAKDEALDLNKKEIDYTRLRRNRDNTEKLYSMVLTRKKESELSGRLTFNNIRVLDDAVLPTRPVKPRVALNMLIGVFLGLLLGVGLAFLVENLDRTVRSQEDVDEIPNLIYLGMIPRIPGAAPVKSRRRRPDPRPEVDLIVHRKPKSPVAEACRAIRTNLLFASPDRPMKRILVSSAGEREGKTTTVASLAITMAQAGSRVVVVDTDMRRPRMHKLFGVSGTVGLTNILRGEGTVEELSVKTAVDNLWLLPCGPTPPAPAELCQSDSFKRTLEALTNAFDRVILDSPPVMAVTDAVVLSTQVDGTLLIARTGRTSRVALDDATRQLIDVGANVLGCVLNDFDVERTKYRYYSYRGYGYRRYGRYQYGYGQYGDSEEPAG